MKQPLFYKGKQLNARDLISLEEYAFSRTNIIIPDHGVVNLFNNEQRPEQSQDRDQIYFIIKEVAGITPAGRPIDFKTRGSDRMALRLKLPSIDNTIWDIYIDDSHPISKEDATEYENDEKYKLSHVPVTAPEPETQKPIIDENKLYLGRYRLSRSSPPEIVSPPYIYSLGSFNFPSSYWQKWTFPIRDALRGLIKKNKSDYVQNFIKDIVYNYPFLSLSQLLRASYQLQWLCQDDALEEILDEGKMAMLQDSLIRDILPASVYNISPGEIPSKIANILIGVDGGILWKLITQQQLSLVGNTITIDKGFVGTQEIKFQFKPGIEVQDYVRLKVDNFYSFEVPRVDDQDSRKNACYCFVIEYPGKEGDQRFTMTLPAGWDPTTFSIYHRLSQS